MKNYIGLACHAIASGFAVGWAFLVHYSGYDECKPAEEIHADYGRLFFDTAENFSAASVAGAQSCARTGLPESSFLPPENQIIPSETGSPSSASRRTCGAIRGCFPFLLMLHAFIGEEVARAIPPLIRCWMPL